MLQASRSTTRDPFGRELPSDVVDAVLQHLNDIVIVTSAGTDAASALTVLYVNPAFERITGYRSEEILGRTPRILSGPETAQPEIRRIEADIAARKPFHAELVSYRKDGSKFLVEIEASLFESAATGNEYWLFVERDVTERRAAERALREHERSIATLLGNLPGMAYRCSADGSRRIYFASAGALALTGYDAEAFRALGGPAFGDLIHAEDKASVADVVSRQTSRGDTFEVTYRIKARDGTEKWVLDRGRSVSADGVNAHLEGFILDITERKMLEIQVLHSQRLESIGTLAGGIAHDLNNIFAPIMMAGDLLADKMADTDSHQLVEAVSVSARRGAELVRQILIFARGMEGPRVAVKPQEIFEEIRTFLERTFPKSIRVEVRIDPDVPAIAGNPSQLHQALLNLCVNARDAMPQGGTLTISAAEHTILPSALRPHPEAVPGEYVRISIRDTGLGIPGAIRAHIFDPFFTTKGVGKGTGLGLSTARSIVKSHGGFLSFDTAEGVGTTFFVHIPAASSGIGAQALGDNPPERAFEPLPMGRGEHVLVVDDEESVRVLMRTTLETFHYRVTTASDGAKALELIGNPGSKIDLAVVDMQMPGMGGTQVIAALKQLKPALPILGSSGLVKPEDRTRAAAFGVTLFLEKPFRVENLIRTVRSAISSPES